ncbi:MAG: hypothetical protein JO129_02995 [Candidatus Dependentiae bacterium]|nr:hypothetical protein [Candidatus Dependentiae bacterium]
MKKLGLIYLLATVNLLNASSESDLRKAHADFKKIYQEDNELRNIVLTALNNRLNINSTDSSNVRELLTVIKEEIIIDGKQLDKLVRVVDTAYKKAATKNNEEATARDNEEKDIKKGYRKGFFNKKK